MRIIKWMSLFLVLAILLAGCGTRVNQSVQSTTKGQELQDLEAARQQGVISEKEFKKQKRKILKRR